MLKKLLLSLIAPAAFILPLCSQTDFEYAVTRHKGNKIVLLEAVSGDDAAMWKEIVDSSGVYEHGFALLNRGNIGISNPLVRIREENIDAFEAWFRQRYGLSNIAKWAALDMGNNLILSGVQTPSAKEFEQMLDQRGIKSPLRQVRDFLRENPDHLDAMTDLLTEVRRRALHVMPLDTTEDLDTEADLRTWGVLAIETDKVFNANWLGLYINFFRPDQEQPERFSNLMKASLRKHIPKVESALRLVPANYELWNIWAWMASSLPDYKWASFVNSFEPIFFKANYYVISASIPSSEVCAWIAVRALKEKDWATVIKFAPAAKWFNSYSGEHKDEWLPGGGMSTTRIIRIKGYPIESAYAPLLEALLRTGDIDGANLVFDEAVRLAPLMSSNSEKAAIAAGIAKSAGMDDLAALWEKGEPFNKAPFEPRPEPQFFALEPPNDGGAFRKQLADLNVKLLSTAFPTSRDLAAMGLEIEGGSNGWWALISTAGQILAQGYAIPTSDDMQAIFARFNIKSKLELYKKYIADNESSPGLELAIAFEIYNNYLRIDEPSGKSQDENVIAEFAWHVNKVLREHPDAMVYLPDVYTGSIAPLTQSELLKSLSKPMLTNIESLLQKKPSSDILWRQWIFWKNVEGNDRSLETMVESVKPSPLTKTGTVPPSSVISLYYEECKKNGIWSKVIGLLKTAWDREFSRLSDTGADVWTLTKASDIGDRLGILLIEVYLRDNKPGEADEIFNAVLGLGGNFSDMAKILELAKEKGHERLAREWGERAKK